MKKASAGIVLYRKIDSTLLVLIAHPGGPYWTKKDGGAWSIPKGEYGEGEEPLAAGRREFFEELGFPAPKGQYIELGSVSLPGKVVVAFAAETTSGVSYVTSNTFTIEWPPKTGSQREFPEIDRAGWFSIEEARVKLLPYQVPFLDSLTARLG